MWLNQIETCVETKVTDLKDINILHHYSMQDYHLYDDVFIFINHIGVGWAYGYNKKYVECTDFW
jgi:hypothetical protein